MKFVLIPLVMVAGHALACPDAKDAMAPADTSTAAKAVPASALSTALAAKPAPAAAQNRKAAAASNRSSTTAALRQTQLATKASADQAKDKTL